MEPPPLLPLQKNLKLVLIGGALLSVVFIVVLTAVLAARAKPKQSSKAEEDTSDTEPDAIQSPLCLLNEGHAYIIGGVNGGGSKKFFKDLKTHFPHLQHVKTRKQMKGINFGANDVLLVQHLWAEITVLDVLAVKQACDCHVFINVHDWTYLLAEEYTSLTLASVHSAYLLREDALTIAPTIKALFKNADRVLHPSRFTATVFSRYFNPSNFYVSPHIDEFVRPGPRLGTQAQAQAQAQAQTQAAASTTRAVRTYIPPIHKSVVRIGVLHQPSEYKGTELIRVLDKTVRMHRGFTVEFKVVGVNISAYEDTAVGFADCLARHGIHGLTLLNKWGETYCYALTKFLNSGLPILYNNYGAVKERLPIAGSESEDQGELPLPYFKLFDTEAEFRASPDVASHPAVARFLDFIITNAQKDAKSVSLEAAVAKKALASPVAVVPPFYTFLLRDDVHVMDIWQQIHARVYPYCFYVCSADNDSKDGVSLTATTSGLNVHNDPVAQLHRVRASVELAAHWGLRGFCLQYCFITHAHAHAHAHALFLTTPLPVPDFKVIFSVNLLALTASKGARHAHHIATLVQCFTHVNYLKVGAKERRPLLHVLTSAGSKKKQARNQTQAELKFVTELQHACIAAGAGFAGLAVIGDFLDSPLYHPGVPRVALNTVHTNRALEVALDGKDFTSAAEVALDGKDFTSAAAAVAEDADISRLLLVDSWNDWKKDTAGQPDSKMGHARLKALKLALARAISIN